MADPTSKTESRKRVPDFFGRLYPDDLQRGSLLGTWVRRAEVDELLDEIERLQQAVDLKLYSRRKLESDNERLRVTLQGLADCCGHDDDEALLAALRNAAEALSGVPSPDETSELERLRRVVTHFATECPWREWAEKARKALRSPVEPREEQPEPCRGCGWTIGHALDCPYRFENAVTILQAPENGPGEQK